MIVKWNKELCWKVSEIEVERNTCVSKGEGERC